jgi:ubiquinone/menaquinone biosynthesis C-methylase UbiE
MPHVCPWWGGYFIDNRFRRLLHKPQVILADLVQPGMAVMDFGCGMGFFTIAMARLVGDEGRVISVDLQQRMLDVLRRRAEKVGVSDRIRTHQCEPDCIGVEGPVDLVLAFWSAHEVPDLEGFLLQVHACLRPDGKFLVAEPRGHVSAKSFDQMIATAENIGMRVSGKPHIRMSRAVVLTKD